MSKRAFRGSLLWGALLAVAVQGASAQANGDGAVLLDVTGFAVVGDSPLSDADTQALLKPYLGARDLAGLEAAAQALETALRDRGYAFYRVIIPAQKPADGLIQLQILQFPLGEVTVSGNQNFARENILASIPELQPGKSPDVAELSRQLGLANEHPAKRVSLLVKEGKEQDTIDTELRVRDAPAEQFFLSFTAQSEDRYDAINRNTGYTRITGGYQRSDLFDRDHALTATYTTSPDHLDRVQQLGLFYWLPLYGYNSSITAFYARSDVNSGAVGSGGTTFNVSGRGEFWGLKLTHTLPKYRETSQNVALSVDDKYFHSGVDIMGAPTGVPDIRSRPLAVRYTARNDQPWGVVGGFIEYATNLPGGSANGDRDYAATRPGGVGFKGAAARWNAYHYGLDVSYAAESGWGLSGRLRGQHAEAPLVSGEQFGLGGVGSVRGLRDREYSGDKGMTISVEALGPVLVDTLRPVVFYDFGQASLVSSQGTSVRSDVAASVGVGARWRWQSQLEASLDLAHVVNGLSNSGTTPGTPAGHTKLNLSVFYRF